VCPIAATKSLEQLELMVRLLQLMLLLLRGLLLQRAAVSPVAAIKSLEQLELLVQLLQVHNALK
jgi:hypothetical protein